MLTVYSVGPNAVKIWLQSSPRYFERSKKTPNLFMSLTSLMSGEGKMLQKVGCF